MVSHLFHPTGPETQPVGSSRSLAFTWHSRSHRIHRRRSVRPHLGRTEQETRSRLPSWCTDTFINALSSSFPGAPYYRGKCPCRSILYIHEYQNPTLHPKGPERNLQGGRSSGHYRQETTLSQCQDHPCAFRRQHALSGPPRGSPLTLYGVSTCP